MTRSIVVALIAFGSLACNEPGADPLACQQGYAFGAYGCAEVAGSVVTASSQAVANATISAGTSADPFDFAQTTTDASGQFRLRLQRHWMMATPSSDTSTAWVHATTATTADSVQVFLNYSPIGKRPVASIVTIHLATP